jgi:ergothioneine biosynthesis protein EgtB
MGSTRLDRPPASARAAQLTAAPLPAPALGKRYGAVRAATVALCAPLQIEDYVVQSMPDASPAKWHLAHTSWFFEEFVLREAAPNYRFHDERFRFLFNSYYNSVGRMHTRQRRGLLSRPSVSEVLAYRSCVDERMQELLRGELPEARAAVITLGINHEEQHQELILTDIKHLLSRNPLKPAYAAGVAPRPGTAAALSYRELPGGLIEVGHTGLGFCFDNELPRHRVHLSPFKLANRLVTNAEFLEFIRDGGYRQPLCWLSDGWTHVRRRGARRPIYWSDSLEHEFTLSGLRELDPAAPVCHLSYYEADAFARWAGKRLPTELEWESAAVLSLTDSVGVEGNFVESGYLHPRALDTAALTQGLGQMFGDLWEWTRSAYAPYPGYAPVTGALGEYNGKFMVNQLVLRGGSCATPRDHMRSSYRNFFNPAARWQFSGVRLASD